MKVTHKMKSFLQWLDEDKFWIRGFYDPVTDTGGIPGPLIPLGVQPPIFDYCFTQDPETGLFPYTTYVYSAPKKSGKTTVEAGLVSWTAEQLPAGSEIYMMANDQEQVEYRAYGDVAFHFNKRNETEEGRSILGGRARVLKNLIEMPNGTKIFALAQDYKSAAGPRQAVTAWDELWGYTSDNAIEMYHELTPIAIPMVPIRFRFIVTYAGKENDESPLRDLYDRVVTAGKKGLPNDDGGPSAEAVPELAHIKDDKGDPVCWHQGKTFIYWDHELRMPWQQDPEYYAEQKAEGLTPNKFLQLHRNMWTTGEEIFIPTVWWDRMKKLPAELMYDPESPYRRHPITIGIDVGQKHDTSAIVGIWYDHTQNLAGVAHHRIWVPSGELEYNMANEIVKHVLWLSHQLMVVQVVADPSNFYGGIVDLRAAGIPTEEFSQSGTKMAQASSNLFSMLQNKRLLNYEAPDLRQQVLNTVAKDTGHSFKIVKQKNSKKHMDATVALAMALYDARGNYGIDTSEPLTFEFPFADRTVRDQEDREKIMREQHLPPELRDFVTKDERSAVWKAWEEEERLNA